MSYQNFFASAETGRRKTPAQTSGKEITSEFRMRNEGCSAQVTKCIGNDNLDGTITTCVIVTDPDTGEIVFNRAFVCKK